MPQQYYLVFHTVHLRLHSNSFFFSLFVLRLDLDNWRTWTSDLEAMSSMTYQFRIAQRFSRILKGQLLHVFDTYVVLNNKGVKYYVGLDNGLLLEEKGPRNYSSKKHPNLPLIFEYPCPGNKDTAAKFHVAVEASWKEEKLIGERTYGGFTYSKLYEATVTTSSKKRLLDYEDSEEERDEENFIL